MLKLFWLRFRIGLSAFALLLLLAPGLARAVDEMLLLLPDDADPGDPRVGAWLDASREEGLRVKVLRDAAFLQLGDAARQFPGVILPDQVHQRASDELVAALEGYVSQGGQLMLVYDAGALTSTGFYAIPKSRLSALAGVDYVLYDELRDYTVGFGPVTGLEGTLRDLQVPPGKSMPYVATVAAASGSATLAVQESRTGAAPDDTLRMSYLPSGSTDVGGLRNFTPAIYHRLRHEGSRQELQARARQLRELVRTVSGPRLSTSRYALSSVTDQQTSRYALSSPADSTTTRLAVADAEHAVSGYGYGYLSYPSYVTRGSYAGTTLMRSPDFGLVAGLRPYGNGSVLFVNLPLGYLKGQTDGMLLHGFLRYFGSTLLKQPRLSDHPSGVGGLVLNWHVDSGEALAPMQQLKNMGVWSQGPFSIHITAGPDTIVPGDGLGMNVPGNPVSQEWIRYFVSLNHPVGSHGGWIHDYYGGNASESNQAEFLPYLVLNKQAIEQVSGRAITEYSAPEGNNPKWALDWLEANGILGYYAGAHTGLGPTRSYQEGRLLNAGLWTFPVTPFGRYATFEEFEEFGVGNAEVAGWYKSLMDFAVANRTSRLIYMHPPGAVEFPDVLRNFLYQARQLKSANRFRWYTITQLSRFGSLRGQVNWQVEAVTGQPGLRELVASHPSSLRDMTWLLPRARFARPSVAQGFASVAEDPEHWVVVALGGKTLRLRASVLP